VPTNTLSASRQVTWLLASGRGIAVGDERLGLQVEFADDRRIGPAARQRHQGAAVLGPQHRSPAPDPVLVFSPAQVVQVEHDLPGGLVLAVLLQGGAPPEAPRVLRVAPEVVVVAAVFRGGRDAGVGIEDLADAALQRAEAFGAGQLAGALGVPLFDPGHRPLAEDVLEPLIRIIGVVGALRGVGTEQERQHPGQQ
jgi:hypothetical protein